MSGYERLFSPGRMGALELPNRLVLPAMEPGLADGQGLLDAEEAAAYYGLRARGGAGLVITGNVAVTPNGRAAGAQPGLWEDSQARPFTRVAEAVHAGGARFFVQLSHAGREVHPLLGWEAVGPSPIPCPVLQVTPRELNADEVASVVRAFGEAAARALSAGADGVELHGAHGYLINQFLSPLTNRREDAYGGVLANRARFAIEVVQEVRRRIGRERPIMVRISADEFVAGGLGIDEGVQVAGLLEEAGADAINVSACNYESAFYNLPNYYLEEGCFVKLAEAVKAEVSVPVVAAGRIRRPRMAEDILARGAADFVAMGRALIADPWLPRKAREGREAEIRPCLSCNRCIDSLSMGPMVCAVNARLQDESWPRPDGGQAKGLALVAGAGPAGLVAACELRDQGYQVVVYEREDRPGGKLNLAALPPRKDPVGEYRDWLVAEAARRGATVRCSEPLTAATVQELRPARVIVATGAGHARPPFAVREGTHLVGVREAFTSPERLGHRVAIIGAGGEGAELADFLSEGGQEVVLVEARRKAGLDLLASLRFFLLRRLEEKGVEVVVKFTVEEVGPGYVLGRRGPRGVDRLEGFDAIVVATGNVASRALADELEAAGVHAAVAGDAREPRSILDAVREGVTAAEGS